MSGLFILLSFIMEFPVLNANLVDVYQTLCPVALDLGHHCLPTSLLWLKWDLIESRFFFFFFFFFFFVTSASI